MKKQKQFKCQNCKAWFPIKKINQGKQLVDNRKYFHKKIVCKRCFDKLKVKDKEK